MPQLYSSESTMAHSHTIVIHDVNASTVKIYIDGTLKYEAAGRGGNSYHFKFGVYGQINESYYMESRWKDIKVLKKCD